MAANPPTPRAPSRSAMSANVETGRVDLVLTLGCVDSWDSLLGANQIQGCFWEAVLGVMDRLVLSDAAWERMAALIIGRPDQKGSTGREIGCSWKVCCGSCAPGLPGAIFRRRLAIGTACSGAS